MRELVGTAEIADRLGVASVQTIHSWRRRYEDTDTPFPEPVAKLRTAMVWAWSDVARWAANNGKL